MEKQNTQLHLSCSYFLAIILFIFLSAFSPDTSQFNVMIIVMVGFLFSWRSGEPPYILVSVSIIPGALMGEGYGYFVGALVSVLASGILLAIVGCIKGEKYLTD